MAGRTSERNGETYMTLEKFDLSPEIGQLKMYIEGLFPDPALNQVANELINNNWRPMMDVSIEMTKKMYEPLLLEYTNAFFGVVPFRKMFL